MYMIKRKISEVRTLNPPSRSLPAHNICNRVLGAISWHSGGSCWATLGVLAGPRWGQEGNVSDSFLLWEQRAGGAEGRGRGESQTISALIRAPSASVSLGVCSLVCVREFGMTPSL